ncbi:TMEM175 family protein [Microbacterium sp. zg.B48]|uniref:TMEM175 family protein n=1 Tax=Microbacterium sp. zg.B48 TaxID=2969408 RepID=UPI00214C1297|nr:TMEM175 family protein [Microbacterium sp. zg.B48]MCR2762767.1 TMEM175 family protein [Microbacterium sp. zg.B48]
MSAQTSHAPRQPLTAERLKSFTDAVVAIAMTLLILPLMESIGDASDDGMSAGTWLVGEWPQLFSFVLSFVLTAIFWIIHHRLFDRVQHVTVPLLWLSLVWMLTIVWLPVATAVVGQLGIDPVQRVLYIGTLLATSLVLLATRIYIRRRPELHAIAEDHQRAGMIGAVTMSTLFAAALVLAVTVPAIGYWSLFLVLLTSPVSAWLAGTRR